MIRCFVVTIITVCLALATAGCSRSPRVTFYTLESAVQPVTAVATMAIPTVSIGPVTLPEVVDRPQLVVRSAANQVEILETYRWAEPLKSQIPRLIAENLDTLLGSNRASSYLQNSGVDTDYRVLVDIQRFESSPGEAVTIDAVWSLRRAVGGAQKSGRTHVREPVKAGGYDPLVAAYGRALFAVSSDLARAIRAEATVGH